MTGSRMLTAASRPREGRRAGGHVPRRGRLAVAAALTVALGGCMNLAPPLLRPALPVPAALPVGAGAPLGAAALPGWRELVRDGRLRDVIALALSNNRDLRVALLNVERSRAQLRLTEADRWPTLSAAAGVTRAPNTKGEEANSLQAGLQLSSYELDLFGRLRNASDAQAATLLSTEAAGRSARLALVTQTAAAWLTLAADGEQLTLARQTLTSRNESLRLTVLREQVGAASTLDVRAAQSLSASALASVAQWERQAAQDGNALALLVGAVVPPALLPAGSATASGLGGADGEWLAQVPVGVSSQALLSRPDILQAEQQLAAANANIGAARAALFPRIALSGSGGQVSNSLAGLLQSGNFAYTLTASAALTLFDAGRNQAAVKVAEVNRDVAVAQYDKAVQTAFREAADGLQAQSTWAVQVQAQRDLLKAEQDRLRLTRLKADNGVAGLVELLDAERSLASAQQALVQVRLAEWLNRLSLYKALGGDEGQGPP